MSLRGVSALNKTITKIFRTFVGVDINFCLDTDFYYYPTKGRIGYAIAVNEREDRLYMDFLHRTFGFKRNDTMDLFVVSLLHEIGHIKTRYNLTESEWNASKDEQYLIEEALEKKPTREDFMVQYFSLPHEYLATAWAMNWVKKHPDRYKRIYRLCALSLKCFYELNKVTLVEEDE